MTRLIKSLIAACLFTGFTGVVYAQHPIEVERNTASGDYLKALSAFDAIPQRRATTASVIAAGRSSWALSLPERASAEFDRVLRDPTLSGTQRARILVSRGIIEFQEGRPQVAVMFAENAVSALSGPNTLRAQAYALWGDSLYKLGRPGEAEEKYSNSLNEALPEEKSSIAFKRGETRMQLAKLDDARADFESVPLRHEQAPSAMRNLAQIAMEQKKFDQAAFLLEKGRENYPDSFLDSWVDYALLSVAAGKHDARKVAEIRAEASKKYAPSDHWFALLDSAAEAYLWSDTREAVFGPEMRAQAKPETAGRSAEQE